MAKRAKITPGLLAAVQRRRERGECWKLIQRDLEAAGLPRQVSSYWRALNRDHARAQTRGHVAAHRARKQRREAGQTGT